MNTKIDDGGPAFPHLETNSTGAPYFDHLGMTLRDYFAGQALAGWLASYGEQATHPVANDTSESVAQMSYQMADAMLAARKASHD